MKETVKIGAAEPTEPGGKRVDYPPKGSNAYGEKEAKQMCGGIAGFPCPEGKKCVDDHQTTVTRPEAVRDRAGICVK